MHPSYHQIMNNIKMTQGLLSSLRIDLELRKSRLPRVGGNTVNRFPWIVFFICLFFFFGGKAILSTMFPWIVIVTRRKVIRVKRKRRRRSCLVAIRQIQIYQVQNLFWKNENVPGGGAPSALVAPPALEEHQQARCPWTFFMSFSKLRDCYKKIPNIGTQ